VIEREIALALAEQVRQVEARLERLLASGWRQARGEAAELRADADLLSETGLTEIARRVAAVAEANDATEALHTIALAVNACRQLRLRLDDAEVPAGWLPLAAPKRTSRVEPDRLLPIARLRLPGRDVWACAWLGKHRWLLLEPPFPEPVAAGVAVPVAETGIFGRLRRQLGQVLGGETPAASFWLRRRLSGSLRWLGRYPLGAQHEVACCALDDVAWETDDGMDVLLRAFRESAGADTLTDGHPILAATPGFSVRKVQRGKLDDYVWLDATAEAELRQMPDDQVWMIVWTERGALVPVARIVPGGSGRPARLAHLIPGTPEVILGSPG
jgi:hypothetical protein